VRIGVFGGTFNPVHYGHLRAAEEAREILSLEKVFFIPSGNPPLKTRDLEEAMVRHSMVKLATANDSFFDVLDIESANAEKSYTVNTIEILQGLCKDSDLYFMLGIDAFLDLPNWWRPEKLVSLVNFAVLSRPEGRFTDLLSSPYLDIDYAELKKFETSEEVLYNTKLKTQREAVLVKVTPVAISSTDIRKRIQTGRSIKYMLPENVESFIISNRLYSTDR
jgi:nicotinate-nucleotide adenylyltransferase